MAFISLSPEFITTGQARVSEACSQPLPALPAPVVPGILQHKLQNVLGGKLQVCSRGAQPARRAREKGQGRRGGLSRARVAAFGARSRVPGESEEPRRRPPQHARHFQAASTFTCAGGQDAETQGDDRAPGVSNCVGPFLPIRFLRGDSEGARMKARVAVLALAALSHAMEPFVRAELSDPSLW